MSDYKLTFKLKQHMPYIHFQHNHLGATLRASDLKPRIDKYLYDNYQIEKQKYQLTISAELKNGFPKEVSQGKEPYFGKHKLCRYDNIELRFNTYFDMEFKDKIKAVLPKVFACENFGSFGSKGYGCFTDENQTQRDFEKLIKDKYKTVYYWDPNTANDSETFFQIKYFYALLKSGINIPDTNPAKSTYYKSKLMEYFLPNIRWEKRGIKKKFSLSAIKNITRNLDQTDLTIPPPPPPDETYKAIKPLFGYSKSQEWKSYYKTVGIDFPDGIDRINSPVFFKIFNVNQQTRIYFMLKDCDRFINNIYPNKKFTYSISGTSENFFTPDTFDYPKFLQYAVNKINNMTSNCATGGTAKKVDDFIAHLTTTKIEPL
ncbi:MAG: hypothetical protein M1480_01295 [Bacteroidetes bacterium]|nr:hypothetical protein [Bacteroidota bacterium]